MLHDRAALLANDFHTLCAVRRTLYNLPLSHLINLS